MYHWKTIQLDDIAQNKNDLDMRKMFKAGAVQEDSTYKALKVETYENFVKVLAMLETGFEEYIVFEKQYYERLPDYELAY